MEKSKTTQKGINSESLRNCLDDIGNYESGYDTRSYSPGYPDEPMDLGYPNKPMGRVMVWATTPWFLAVVMAIIVSLSIAVIAGVNGKRQSAAPKDSEREKIETAKQRVQQEKQEELELITRTDLNPYGASNPGLLQRAVLTAAIELRHDIESEQSKTEEDKQVIQQRIQNNALQLINNDHNLQPVYLVRRDPKTNGLVTVRLNKAQIVAYGLIDLQIAYATERDVLQPSEMSFIGTTVTAYQQRIKDSRAVFLGATGQSRTAQKLSNMELSDSSIFGGTPKTDKVKIVENIVKDCPPAKKTK